MKPDEPNRPWMTLEDAATRRISFAQNAEDILLERVFPGAEGFYIDAGANDPVFHSVTKRFYDRGWRGINIEPNLALHRRLIEERPDEFNLPCGLGNAEGSLTFHEFPAMHGWSTFVSELANHYRAIGYQGIEHSIPVTTLAKVCAEHVGSRTIDFLKVDVEGFEPQVLAGGDWSRWRPRVVLLEATWYPSWEPFLLSVDYRFVMFDGVNRYYTRKEEPELAEAFEAPVNILDLYLPYDVVRLIEELEAESTVGRFKRKSMGRVKSWARKHPRVKTLANRILRRVS
jgi:FkbM family methyltransferase